MLGFVEHFLPFTGHHISTFPLACTSVRHEKLITDIVLGTELSLLSGSELFRIKSQSWLDINKIESETKTRAFLASMIWKLEHHGLGYLDCTERTGATSDDIRLYEVVADREELPSQAPPKNSESIKLFDSNENHAILQDGVYIRVWSYGE